MLLWAAINVHKVAERRYHSKIVNMVNGFTSKCEVAMEIVPMLSSDRVLNGSDKTNQATSHAKQWRSHAEGVEERAVTAARELGLLGKDERL